MIYLDNAATTPVSESVEEAMKPFSRQVFGNPSSLHRLGREARTAVDNARDKIADILGAHPSEIIFTGSGTEADNLAIKGVARSFRSRGNHIITSAIEHHAVLESCKALEPEGFRVTYLTPDEEGIISPEKIGEAITPDTILVSIMYANNEVGTIQPITEIGAICRNLNIPLHTDAVQAAGEIDLSVAGLPVDLFSLSAHKIYGPKGIGLLYLRSGTRLQPIINGGVQEEERRAGTENVAGIVGFAAALAECNNPEDAARIRSLRDRLIDGLLSIPDSRLHGSLERRLAGNANLGFAGISGETLLVALDLEDVAVSTGAACSAGSVSASHVLQAMGFPMARAQEAVRFSLGRGNSKEEIDRTILVTKEVVSRLRRHRRTG